MKKLLTVLLATVILTAALPARAADVPSEWAAASVEDAFRLGFVHPVLQYDISQNYQADITRQEFAAIASGFVALNFNYDPDNLWTILGDTNPLLLDGVSYPGKVPFLDLEEKRWHRGVETAYWLGIVDGRDASSFDPDAPITRQEAAAMLTRTYAAYGGVLPQPSGEVPEAFTDGAEIAPWARDSAAFLSQHGVMDGVGEGRFDPLGHYSREQCLTTFMRLLANMPVSRDKGNIVPYQSFEELTAYLKTLAGSPESPAALFQQLDFSGVTVLILKAPGKGEEAPSTYSLWLTYPQGGFRSVKWTILENGGLVPENLKLNEADRQLHFTVNVPARFFDRSGTTYEAGTYSYTADPLTGEAKLNSSVPLPGAEPPSPALKTLQELQGANSFYTHQLLQTDICTILSGGIGGTPHGSYAELYLIYPDGTYKQVLNKDYPSDSVFGSTPSPDVTLNADNTAVTFSRTFADRMEVEGSIYHHEAGTYYFSVDLATGVMTWTLDPLVK